MADKKPIGSGYFALVWGVLFLLACGVSLGINISALDPYKLLQCWLGFAAAVLIVWGGNRVLTGDKQDRRIGQETINLIVGIVAATAALMALVKPR